MNFELLNPIPPDDTLAVVQVGDFGSGWYVVACIWQFPSYSETVLSCPYIDRPEAYGVRKQCEELRALTKRLAP